ncbi:MAG: tRNA (N6-isopentenyl adenosine(37)-C2)-methylthiotransferase MiaB [Spirochaetes bacterium]|nr:tRNA (N6-isopentenyl adenosine(37)-C2)-methylthiotransferase MiaB [Spirochaetota bacterium]
MTYLIETYGCQMNKAESAALEGALAGRGWTQAVDPLSADLVLINTCSVRMTAENRAWGRIAFYAAAKRSRDFLLVVTGCMAERMKRDMREAEPAIDYVLGNFQKDSLGPIADAAVAGTRLANVEEKPVFSFAGSHHEPGAFRSFVPIMHGCDNFCSYCIVPYLRGREISRDPGEIMSELDALEDSGVREVTLLGQNVNSYRWSSPQGKLGFPGLLSRIAGRVHDRDRGGIRWIRFLTSHPKDLSDELIAVLASDPLFCRHIHLCVQHGSDRILGAMNRRYTRDSYLRLVERIRKEVPDVTLSTDILIGFPGETDEDVDLTLDLMRRVAFAYSYMYYYNPRTGTPAASMDGQVPASVKKARLARVIGLQKELSAAAMSGLVGSEVEVLIESVSRRKKTELLARTAGDMMVVFEGDSSRIGSFAKVHITSLKGNTFKAEELW